MRILELFYFYVLFSEVTHVRQMRLDINMKQGFVCAYSRVVTNDRPLRVARER